MAVSAYQYLGTEGYVHIYPCNSTTCSTAQSLSFVSSRSSYGDGGMLGYQMFAWGNYLAVAAPFKDNGGVFIG